MRVRLAGDRAALTIATPQWTTPAVGDVAVVVIPTGVLAVVTPHGMPDPSIEGDGDLARDLVAWDSATCGAYDLASARSFTPPKPMSNVGQAWPAIDRAGGRRIAFADSYRASIWDLDRQTLTEVTDYRLGRTFTPTLSGDWVAFERGNCQGGADCQIVAHQLSSGAERVLSDGLDGNSHGPAFDNDGGARLVFWHRRPTDGGEQDDVYLYDFASGERTRLSSTGYAVEPRLSGGLACWTDRSPDVTRQGVAVHALDSGREAAIAPYGSGCDISGRRVAYLKWTAASSVQAFYRDLLDGEP
jgi:hypothetical protein